MAEEDLKEEGKTRESSAEVATSSSEASGADSVVPGSGVCISEDDDHQSGDEEDVFLFGYGSLIWKPPDMEFVEAIDCYVEEGWARRFWQGSPDHRGTLEAPGRVCTLLSTVELKKIHDKFKIQEEVEKRVWGRIFRIKKSVMDERLAQLEHREKAGYDKVMIKCVCPEDGVIREAMAFRATPENAHFLGPVPGANSAQEVAKHIAFSRGSSGPNHEYFMNLILALQEMQKKFQHIDDAIVDTHLQTHLSALSEL